MDLIYILHQQYISSALYHQAIIAKVLYTLYTDAASSTVSGNSEL